MKNELQTEAGKPAKETKAPIKMLRSDIVTEFDQQFENVNEMFREMNYDPLRNMASSSNFIGNYLHAFCDLNEEMRTLKNQVDAGETSPEEAQELFDIHIDKVSKFVKLRHDIDSTAVKYYKPSKKAEEPPIRPANPEDAMPMIAQSFSALKQTADNREAQRKANQQV